MMTILLPCHNRELPHISSNLVLTFYGTGEEREAFSLSLCVWVCTWLKIDCAKKLVWFTTNGRHLVSVISWTSGESQLKIMCFYQEKLLDQSQKWSSCPSVNILVKAEPAVVSAATERPSTGYNIY